MALLVTVPTEDVITYFNVIVDNDDPVMSSPVDLGDGTVRLEFDLDVYSFGPHSAAVSACNDEGCSIYSDALSFTLVPDVPATPIIEGIE